VPAADLDPTTLGLQPFRPRLPWCSGDLQTLRDSLRPVRLPRDSGRPVEIGVGGGDRLLALFDPPAQGHPLALVLLMHGLGGSSDREGLRRMGLTLQQAGFAVLRLNMRGAGPGRALARGTYAARCNSDLLPAIRRARELADQLAPGGRPLLGMGISLGGTKLLNALQAGAGERDAAGLSIAGPLLDGLVCISSPLDLEVCSAQIERPRNGFYQHWLLRRLVEQTLADPFGISDGERTVLEGRAPAGPLRSIRAFDAAITAPRWGYGSVASYYRDASPLPGLRRALRQGQDQLPPTLLIHAADDPWVPVATTLDLQGRLPVAGSRLQVLITARGGHNGFHGAGDGRADLPGAWGDRLTARWFQQLLA
jgi:predicted alpha/beta-fold hydrolase